MTHPPRTQAQRNLRPLAIHPVRRRAPRGRIRAAKAIARKPATVAGARDRDRDPPDGTQQAGASSHTPPAAAAAPPTAPAARAPAAATGATEAPPAAETPVLGRDEAESLVPGDPSRQGESIPRAGMRGNVVAPKRATVAGMPDPDPVAPDAAAVTDTPAPAPDAAKSSGSAPADEGQSVPRLRVRGNAVARKSAAVAGSRDAGSDPPDAASPDGASSNTATPAAAAPFLAAPGASAVRDPAAGRAATVRAPDTAASAGDRRESPARADPAGHGPSVPRARVRGNALPRTRAAVAGLSDRNSDATPATPPAGASLHAATTAAEASPLTTPTASVAPDAAESPVPVAPPDRGHYVSRARVRGKAVARKRATVAYSPGRDSDPQDARPAPGAANADATTRATDTSATAPSPLGRVARAAVRRPADRKPRAALIRSRAPRIAGRSDRPVDTAASPAASANGHHQLTHTNEPPAGAPLPTPTTRPLVRAGARRTRSLSTRRVPTTIPSAGTAGAPRQGGPRQDAPPQEAPFPAGEAQLLASLPFLARGGAPNRPTGQSLARAIGATHERDGSGRSTVVFPQPPSRVTPAPTNGGSPRMARQVTELGAVSLNGHAPGLPPSSAPTSAMEAGGQEAADFDDLYDRVLSRLRRDLIVERERRGDLAGAYFRRG